jgi:hypothetical protein
MEIPILS